MCRYSPVLALVLSVWVLCAVAGCQLRKLQREVRREQKGVARELRKDALYLAKVGSCFPPPRHPLSRDVTRDVTRDP